MIPITRIFRDFAIETHCNGNESGILTTKADYWILGNLEYVYIFTKENLEVKTMF